MAYGLYLLEDTIRKCDEAVYNWLGEFRVDYGDISGTTRNNHPILRVFSSPHRAFAETINLLVSQNWISGSTAEEMRRNAWYDWTVVPLPIVSIERDDPIISNELSGSTLFIHRARRNPETKEYETDPYPLHYLTQYRITFWCDKRYTHAAFMEWLLSQLGRAGAAQSEMFLEIEHPPPYGKQLHQWRYIGSANLSDLEGNDSRHIRSLLSFVLRSWAFRKPVYSAPEVFKVQSFVDEGSVKSENLWTNSLFIFEKTPGFGVSYGDARALPPSAGFHLGTHEQRVLTEKFRIKLLSPGDSVVFGEYYAVLNRFGYTVWMVALDSSSTIAVDREYGWYFVVDGGEGTEISSIIPVSSVRATRQWFIVTRSPVVRFRALYAEFGGEVLIHNLVIKQQLYDTPVFPLKSVDADTGAVYYDWRNLEMKNYLMVMPRVVADAELRIFGRPVGGEEFMLLMAERIYAERKPFMGHVIGGSFTDLRLEIPEAAIGDLPVAIFPFDEPVYDATLPL